MASVATPKRPAERAVVRPRLRRGALLLGGVFAALLMLLAWGGLRDGASAAKANAPGTANPVAGALSGTKPPLVPAAADAAGGPGASPVSKPTLVMPAVTERALKLVPATKAAVPAATSGGPLTAQVKGLLPTINAPTPGSKLGVSSPTAAPAAAPAAAAAPPLAVTPNAVVAGTSNQCNPPAFPTGAGFEVTCDVKIVNTITPTGGTSSTVTETACLAAAGVVPPSGCTTTVTNNPTTLTTGVNQCNGIVNGGGSNVTCTVEVTNNVPVGTGTTGVTVNQCNGSGGGGVSPVGPPTNCAPVANTTNATVDQCNGSANGGGAPLRVKCTVTGGASAIPVSINQCNGSSNGGGSTVTCSTTITNNFVAGGTGGGGTGGGGTGGGGTGGGGTGGGGTGGGGTGGGGTGGGGTGGGGTGGGGTPPPVTPPVVVTPNGPSVGTSGVPVAASTPAFTLVAASAPEAIAARGPAAANETAGSLPAQPQVPATGLAFTGSSSTTLLLLALMALALGALMVFLSKLSIRGVARTPEAGGPRN